MSKEWITDENCNSVIEKKEEQKLQRDNEQVCATIEFTLCLVAEPVLIFTSLCPILPPITYCL